MPTDAAISSRDRSSSGSFAILYPMLRPESPKSESRKAQKLDSRKLDTSKVRSPDALILRYADTTIPQYSKTPRPLRPTLTAPRTLRPLTPLGFHRASKRKRPRRSQKRPNDPAHPYWAPRNFAFPHSSKLVHLL